MFLMLLGSFKLLITRTFFLIKLKLYLLILFPQLLVSVILKFCFCEFDYIRCLM